MSLATIQLTKQTADDALPHAEKSVWPLTIVALGTGIDSNIFVYQVVPATDTVPGDRFQCVASVAQLNDLPVNQAIPRSKQHGLWDIPFYRINQVEFICHSAVEVEELWDLIQNATQRLVDNYNQWTQMQNQQVVVIATGGII